MEQFPSIAAYQLIELIGQGGHSRVYRAQKKRTGHTVALKVLAPQESSGERYARAVERFKREAEICARLQHPHIVKLADCGQTEAGEYFAEYEYVPGPTLKQIILEQGGLSAEETGHLMAQILDALSCAHAHGVVHRDLKPQNIIVTRTGSIAHIKVLDFGIGAFSNNIGFNDQRNLTLTHELVCTPTYAAPEQLRGEPPTVKSDLYAWGLIVLECLQGSPVYKGYTIAEIYQQQLSVEDVPVPPAIARHPLGALLARCLQKRCAEREGQAERLYQDFKALNLATLVGLPGPAQIAAQDAQLEATVTLNSLREERRQISVLACRLDLSHAELEAQHELIDALLADLLQQCEHLARMHGAHCAGRLCDGVAFYFGYPFVADDDCRRAARVALDIAAKMQNAAANLAAQHGLTLVFQLGLHSGMMTLGKQAPSFGLTPSIAMQLSRHERPNSVIVSVSSARLLQQYCLLTPCAAPLHPGAGGVAALRLLGERDVEALSIFHDIRRQQHAIVGRSAELAALLAQQKQSLQGRTCISILRGEAGIGKSRLVFEVRRHLQGTDLQLIEGRCTPEQRNNALFPLFHLLRRVLQLDVEREPQQALQRLEAGLQAAGIALEPAMQILCSWLWLPLPERFAPVLHSPQMQKNILLDSLTRLLLHGATPKLFVIEDLHWADPTTLEWLDGLCRQPAAAPAWFLLTARPHFHPPWPPEAAHALDLQHLSEQDSAALVQDIIGARSIAPQALAFLAKRIDGVPLFAEELIAMLLEQQILSEQDGVLLLNQGHDSLHIPLTLKDSLNHRLQSAGAVREVAQFAAVLGREFGPALLANVLSRDDQTLQLELEQLCGFDLLYRKRNIDGDSYVFRHALIRDAAYDSLKGEDRKSIHLRVAGLLEDGLTQLEQAQIAEKRAGFQQLATHYAEAGCYGKAIEYGAQSSDLSLQQFLIEETLEQSRQVERWLEKSDTPAVSLELGNNRIMMQALMAKHGWADPTVAQYAQRSQALAASLESYSESDPAIWTMAASFIFHFVKSDRPGMESVRRQMFDFAQNLQSAGLSAAAMLMQGFEAYNDADFPAAEACFLNTIQNYLPQQHQHFDSLFGFDFLAWAKGILSLVYWHMGRRSESAQFLQEAEDWARQRAHIPSICICLLYRGILGHYRNDKTQARLACEELLALSNQYGLPAFAGYATPIHLWALENPDPAPADQIIAFLQNMGCNTSLSFYASLAADTLLQRGLVEDAARRIDSCLELARCNREFWHEVNLYQRKAECLLHPAQSDLPAAQAVLQQALQLAQSRSMSIAAHELQQCLAGLPA